MSARRVCSGDAAVGVALGAGHLGAAQATATWILQPLAPERIALVSARFIARRKATRFCSCSATDCATSLASSSGRLISRMLTLICFRVHAVQILAQGVDLGPDLPITMPGRAVSM